MAAPEIARIVDPLLEQFALGDLPKIAPWVAEEIESVGTDTVRSALADLGCDIDEPQFMTVWVSAVSRCHSDLWRALAVG